MEFERSDRISVIRSSLTDVGIEVLEPTSIQAPLSFNEGEIFFYTENDVADVEDFVSKFVEDYVQPRSERVFMWEEGDTINIATLVIREDIPEMHYISIEVGS